MTITPRYWVVGLSGILVVSVATALFLKASHSDAQGLTQEAPAYVPPVQGWKETAQGTPAEAAKAGPDDLLGLVDVRQDAIAGTWGFYGRSLITSSSEYGRLQFPVEVPEEYDLKLTVTRARGSGALRLGLPSGGHQAMIEIDASDKPTTSLLLADGYEPGSNETTRAGKLLRWNLRTSIVCSVRKGGIALDVDGKRIIDWKGDRREWVVLPAWLVPSKKAPFVGTDDTAFRIDEAVLTPVSGRVMRLR
jgi:hypothetical protein